jgi:hypothetical protein
MQALEIIYRRELHRISDEPMDFWNVDEILIILEHCYPVWKENGTDDIAELYGLDDINNPLIGENLRKLFDGIKEIILSKS